MTTAAALVAAAATIWLLKAGAVVFLPLAVAVFLAMLVQPLLLLLRRRLPEPLRWVAVAITFAVVVGSMLLAIVLTGEAVDELIETAPTYRDRAAQLWDQATSAAAARGLPLPREVVESSALRERWTALATSAVRTTWEVLSLLVLVVFLLLLLLLETPAWTAKAHRVLHGHGISTVTAVAAKVRQYVWVRTLLGLMSAAATAAWLLLMGVDLVLLWVVLTFALNYVPNVGAVISVLPPSLLALLQHGPSWGLLTFGGLVVIEQVIGDFIDPRLSGRRLELSPVVVLMSLVFWTWLWGVPGAFLAVPMTVAVAVFCDHVPALRPVAALLSRTVEPPVEAVERARSAPLDTPGSPPSGVDGG